MSGRLSRCYDPATRGDYREGDTRGLHVGHANVEVVIGVTRLTLLPW